MERTSERSLNPLAFSWACGAQSGNRFQLFAIRYMDAKNAHKRAGLARTRE